MNAVVKPILSASESPARAALHAYRERMRAIEREAAPLRGQLHALQTNVTAVQEQKAAAHAKVQERLTAFNAAVVAEPAGEHRELSERWADARAEFERLDLREGALQNAARVKADEIRAVEARVNQEPIPLLALLHAALCERMEAVVEDRRRAKEALSAIEEEVEAHARAADELAVEYQNQHGTLAPGMSFLAGQLQFLRENEHKTLRHLVHGQLPARIQSRAAEIRREVEAS